MRKTRSTSNRVGTPGSSRLVGVLLGKPGRIVANVSPQARLEQLTLAPAAPLTVDPSTGNAALAYRSAATPSSHTLSSRTVSGAVETTEFDSATVSFYTRRTPTVVNRRVG